MSQVAIRPLLALARPFTLLAPFVGFLSAAVMAKHSLPPPPAYIGAIAAMLLNAASNGLNQIFDIEIDRINKPNRPLPSKRMTIHQASIAVLLLYGASIALAAFVNRTFLIIVLFTAFATYAYSAPPLRAKRICWLANLTIAVPRGLLLIVAGWASVAEVNAKEPWFIGMVFGLFVLGAASTKDFADMNGDRAQGCMTLPIVLGVRKAAWVVATSLVVPFLLIPVGVATGTLSGNHAALLIVSALLVAWGAYAGHLLVRRPEELATERNHPSWKHMYLILLFAQVGIGISYLL
ncbi:MAG TPA: UbiA family prenyltransferase [bacterium]|nr:UbiA family prenyltransferase [bacterium]